MATAAGSEGMSHAKRARPLARTPATRLVIRNGTVITIDPQLGDLERADVLVEDGRIAAVGPDLDVADAAVVDATDRIVMPGLVDTHRHTWQALFRNIGSDW